jgi:CheY-like chemotaxis protein
MTRAAFSAVEVEIHLSVSTDGVSGSKNCLLPGIFFLSSGNKCEGLFSACPFRVPSGHLTPQGGTLVKAILFVDDHEVLARLSCEILEMNGYRAVSAYSAQEALQKFEQQDFDILVTDFRMEGMNGLELAREVHARRPETPVIIVTGYGPVDGGKDVVACLQKEELFPALLEKIKYFIEQPAVTAPEQKEIVA